MTFTTPAPSQQMQTKAPLRCNFDVVAAATGVGTTVTDGGVIVLPCTASGAYISHTCSMCPSLKTYSMHIGVSSTSRRSSTNSSSTPTSTSPPTCCCANVSASANVSFCATVRWGKKTWLCAVGKSFAACCKKAGLPSLPCLTMFCTQASPTCCGSALQSSKCNSQIFPSAVLSGLSTTVPYALRHWV
eukprot:CAMPEP_0179017120 /NCGR_PEP_ID=MMETSP0796-20121207/3676_1 /TAXON_ID=73915 /ORGANISM="Pyrodinium bahamense, Strain pbaha01" /LENGTH=187 /DNA_ID=CAMNT_0020712841 /DNA_START=253 /DNA_END=816 /DNA_ORIENTATION=+